jgi:hypothetical protein
MSSSLRENQQKIIRKSREKIKGKEGGCFNKKPITAKQQKQQQLQKQKIKNKNKNIKGRRENFKKGEEKRKGKERTATYGDP